MAMNDVEELLKVRGQQYGNSWKVTGEVINLIGVPALAPMTYIGLLFPWIMIINKAIRALFNPAEKDNWMDIAGYATLAMQDLEKRSQLHVDGDENRLEKPYVVTAAHHS